MRSRSRADRGRQVRRGEARLDRQERAGGRRSRPNGAAATAPRLIAVTGDDAKNSCRQLATRVHTQRVIERVNTKKRDVFKRSESTRRFVEPGVESHRAGLRRGFMPPHVARGFRKRADERRSRSNDASQERRELRLPRALVGGISARASSCRRRGHKLEAAMRKGVLTTVSESEVRKAGMG